MTVESDDFESRPVKAMIIDPSAHACGLYRRWFASDRRVHIAATHYINTEALANITESDPDIVLIDIADPVEQSLALLPAILARKPGLAVIVSWSQNRFTRDLAFRAMALGAHDFVIKPDDFIKASDTAKFRESLRETIWTLGCRARKRTILPARAEPGGRQSEPSPTGQETDNAAWQLVPCSHTRPEIIAFGASTGGPQALRTILGDLRGHLQHLPILVVQHIPATFVPVLAKSLAASADRPAREAVHGETIDPGQIYMAPGGKHLSLKKKSGKTVVNIDDGPPINYCKPSVDPLFCSIAEIYQSAALAVILTGMGHDGVQGATHVARQGGSVVAQDKKTSVVWGMPGAAVRASACCDLLPLDAIGKKLIELGG